MKTFIVIICTLSICSEIRADSKPWVQDVIAYTASHPGSRYIVASSSRTCVTQAEATAEARSAAARSVFELIKPMLNYSVPVDEKQAIKSIERSFARTDLVVDRDVEKIDRPYATLWCESQLLDVSPRRLDSILGDLKRTMQRERMATFIRIGAAGILLIGVGLFYRLFNAITRGYFTGRLRLAAFVAASAVVLAAVSVPWPI